MRQIKNRAFKSSTLNKAAAVQPAISLTTTSLDPNSLLKIQIYIFVCSSASRMRRPPAPTQAQIQKIYSPPTSTKENHLTVVG